MKKNHLRLVSNAVPESTPPITLSRNAVPKQPDATESFEEKTNRIKDSLIKIDTLMKELKKMAEKQSL